MKATSVTPERKGFSHMLLSLRVRKVANNTQVSESVVRPPAYSSEAHVSRKVARLTHENQSSQGLRRALRIELPPFVNVDAPAPTALASVVNATGYQLTNALPVGAMYVGSSITKPTSLGDEVNVQQITAESPILSSKLE